MSCVQEDANVILVNWAKGADNINYIQAAANTRVVGALIAQLMTSFHLSGGAAYRYFCNTCNPNFIFFLSLIIYTLLLVISRETRFLH